jgi:hypothetical protein
MIDWQPLDLIACFRNDRQSRWRSLMNFSLSGPFPLFGAPARIAVVCQHEGKNLLVECTDNCSRDCVINGTTSSGCQAHNVVRRIHDLIEANERPMLFRLVATDQLSSAESGLLTKILIEHFVRAGVQLQGGRELLSGCAAFNDRMLNCSGIPHDNFFTEIVAKVLMRLNRLSRCNPLRYDAATLLRELVHVGTFRYVGIIVPAVTES